MKKGFTMIELIFVIVILGILASVAIPRLAATREDAEISAAVANLRTLVSEASGYYVAQGTFDGATWNQITNVPLDGATKDAVGAAATAHLKVKGENCIGVHLVNKAGDTPAYIKFTAENSATGVCKQVVESAAVKDDFLDKKVGSTETDGIAVGSSTGVYKPAASKPEPSSS